jgi:GLUG motif-containing protein
MADFLATNSNNKDSQRQKQGAILDKYLLRPESNMAGKSIRVASAALVAMVCLAAPARASLSISTKPTQNVSCSAGVCTATAKKAVLNVDDLANLLAAGDMKVVSGGTARDIEVSASLSWVSTSRLTLDAFHSIAFNKPVTVAGTGALTIITNDGGSGGDFRFFKKGHVEFWDLSSSLTINGQPYLLADSIHTLAHLIHLNNTGFYALAKHVNSHKQYLASPIDNLSGTLEGLGNTISNLAINSDADRTNVALIGRLTAAASSATIRDIGLVNATVTGTNAEQCVGTLVGTVGDLSKVLNSFASGTVEATGARSLAGGLACDNEFGTIANSYSTVAVSGASASTVGGLVGLNEGTDCPDPCHGRIDQSYSGGAVSSGDGSMTGGLVGRNLGAMIIDSYSSGAVLGGGNGPVGGLIGSNENSAGENAFPEIGTSYSIGAVSGASGAIVGGLVGQDVANPNITDTYWDLDTSGVSDPSQGAGNIANDPGITGLTDAQLKSALPTGFSSSVWAQAANVNDGYPYLIAVPPK